MRDAYSYIRDDNNSSSEDEQDVLGGNNYNDDYEYNNELDEGDEEDDGDCEDDNGVRSKEDPLASQVWKMYSKAKDSLDGQRMENMTWRMMSLSLHKKDANAQNTSNQPRLVLIFLLSSSPLPPTDTFS
jgi:hypothetical protein